MKARAFASGLNGHVQEKLESTTVKSRRSNYPEIASPRTLLEPVYCETRSVHCPEGNRQLEQIL
jgi:hypothetical protein